MLPIRSGRQRDKSLQGCQDGLGRGVTLRYTACSGRRFSSPLMAGDKQSQELEHEPADCALFWMLTTREGMPGGVRFVRSDAPRRTAQPFRAPCGRLAPQKWLQTKFLNSPCAGLRSIKALCEIEYAHRPELAPTKEMLDAYKACTAFCRI